MLTFEKILQDSDSQFCLDDDCTSNQTSFFLGQTSDQATLQALDGIFGAGFADNDSVKIHLSRRNILINLLCHYVSETSYYKRKDKHADPVNPWALDRDWLLERIKNVEKCMGERSDFTFQIHRENDGLQRVYLKGLKQLSADGGVNKMDLQLLFFSGDTIRFNKTGDLLSLDVTIADVDLAARVEGWLVADRRNIGLKLPTQVQAAFSTITTDWLSASASSRLNYSHDLMKRFLSSMQAKPFVLLSGLSGSGKTKLAQLLVRWLAVGGLQKDELMIGESFKDGAYEVKESDQLDYKILVQESGKLRTVSKNAVHQWLSYYVNHPEAMDLDSKDVRKAIQGIDPVDDNYMHGSDAVLANIAKGVLKIRNPFVFNEMTNWLLIPVGADWTNSEKLLGYPDALQPGKYVMPDTGVLKLMLDARDNPKLPFFLILDEMNLSHVERYFADFLSAMESGEDIKLHGGKENYEGSDGTKVPPTLKFPKNLFVIGTMNVDETTYMFSPKVLDRAQVIEFRVDKDEMAAFLDNPTTPNLDVIAGKGAKYAEAFLKLKDNPPALDEDAETTNKDAINTALKKFFEPLAELGAEFGYRTAGEVIRFCRYYLAAGATIDDAIDAAIVQKLLPKLHGSQQRLAPVLRKLKELASTTAMQQDGEGEAKKIQLPLYKLTCEKLDRMLIRLKANGFTSFAEA